MTLPADEQPSAAHPEPAVPPTSVPPTTASTAGTPAPTPQQRAGRRREEISRERQLRRYGQLMDRARRGGRRADRAAQKALILEQQLHGRPRDPGTDTFAETLVRSVGKARGDRELERTQKRLARQARRQDRLRTRQEQLLIKAGMRRSDLVKHPDGGVRTVEATQQDQEAQRQEIAGEAAEGSQLHHRLPARLRRVPALVVCFDAALLLYFFSGVTNVDWTRPFSAALMFAVMLTGAVTVISFGFFRLAGDILNGYKADDGLLRLDELDVVAKTVTATAGLGISTLATLMFVRMRTEVLDALGPENGGTAMVIAITLAVVSILANGMVVGVHALDGSEATARLDGLGSAVEGPLRDEHRLREQAAALGPVIAEKGRVAVRTMVAGITRAGRPVADADRLVDASRAVHQGAGLLSGPTSDPNRTQDVHGYRTPGAFPKVDERPVRLLVAHLTEGTPTAASGDGAGTEGTTPPAGAESGVDRSGAAALPTPRGEGETATGAGTAAEDGAETDPGTTTGLASEQAPA